MSAKTQCTRNIVHAKHTTSVTLHWQYRAALSDYRDAAEVDQVVVVAAVAAVGSLKIR